MLSLGGAIGTGLFWVQGKSFHKLDLLAQLLPIFLGCNCLHGHALFRRAGCTYARSGSFGAYARKYISPSTGYMISWMYWLTWTATLGTEFTAAALLMQEWFPQISMWIWTLIFAVTIFGLNISSTRVFAESEFWLALVKVITVIAFIVLGLLAILV